MLCVGCLEGKRFIMWGGSYPPTGLPHSPVVKNWMTGRPGNKARSRYVSRFSTPLILLDKLVSRPHFAELQCWKVHCISTCTLSPQNVCWYMHKTWLSYHILVRKMSVQLFLSRVFLPNPCHTYNTFSWNPVMVNKSCCDPTASTVWMSSWCPHTQRITKYGNGYWW